MIYTLQDLGWSNHFARLQDATPGLSPLRVAEVHRSRILGLGPAGEVDLVTHGDMTSGDIAVGDWVLADPQNRIATVLDRKTLLSRRAAGTDARTQLIAANVDTLFIVSSCNDDFNVPRLERYLALAYESGAYPVIVLTKRDLCGDPYDFIAQAEAIRRDVPVLAVNAMAEGDLTNVASWCGKGQTAALVGSSGVGKSTLLNGLTGSRDATAGIREDDARGRHTTTHRSLRPMTNGGWLIDTPGMRALRLHDAAEGIEAVFDDLTALAAQCRFTDCHHDGEPGCAVQVAIDTGQVTPDRLDRWRKLQAEDARNSETLAQSRARDKAFGKLIRQVKRDLKTTKGR